MKKKQHFPDYQRSGLKKLLLVMKLSTIFLFLTVMAFSANTFSQETQFDLKVKNASIIQVFDEIERITDYGFLFKTDQLDLHKQYTFDLKNADIERILNEVLNKDLYSYKLINKNIVITRSDSNMEQDNKSRKVTGKVTDNSGVTMPGVSVVVKGSTNGTITDSNGNFSLTNVTENSILQFSFVGMKTQEVAVSGKTVINVALLEETVGIEEVVAVGYATQKKVNMTGAVSSIKFDDVATSRPITNLSSALSGLSSGVTVRQGNGKPGSEGATIRVRGIGTLNNSNPLVIIDGMEGSLDAVNPQDIESVSILKDAASASIYGSRAANGVILVTTKKGNGKRLNVTYNGTFSVAEPANLLDFVSDYPKYMRLMNESARNVLITEPFSTNTISAWETANKDPNALNANGVPNYVAFPNTNWNKEVYRKSLVQDHTISVNGSTNNARFLLSAGYLDNPGLVEFTGMKRYSLRSNVEIDATKWLTLGTRTYATMNDTELGNYDNVWTYIYQSTPGVYPRYNGKFGYPEAPEESATANNVYNFLYGQNGDNKTFRINSTLYTKVNITKGLSWDCNFNYSKRFDEQNNHTNPAVGERVKFSSGVSMSPQTAPSLMTTYFRTYSNYSYTLENLLRYETTFAGKHNINALAGYNETYFFGYDHYATKRGLFDQSAFVFNAATEMLSIGGSATDWALRSWFGRLNYAFNQKYMFEANMRYDGSSRFDSESRHGLFPSFSAGWRISEEGFIKNMNMFQNLKLRASWGKLGNNASGDYDFQALYGPVGYSFNGVQTTGLRSGKIPNPMLQWESTTVTNLGLDATLLDSKLSAELDVYNKVTDGILTTPPVYLTMGLVGAPTLNTAEVTNKGFEITLNWKDKIGQVNYSISGNLGYNKNEVTGYKGKLVEEWRTDATGKQVYYSNLGDVSSGDRTRILEGHAINENYLMDVYKGDGSYFKSDGTVNIDGGPKDGMIRTTDDMKWLNSMISAGYQFMPNLVAAKNRLWYGDYIYADMNKDGIYGSNYDRRFTGNSNMPRFTFGSQMNFSWKNFDLNLIWSGQAGVKIYWLESGYNNSGTRIGFQIGKMIENDHYYYNEADPSDPTNNLTGSYPRLRIDGGGQNTQNSTRWLYDGSYVRLKNLTLGYTLPKHYATKIFTENVRLYFSAENLFTITSFPGLDPEMGGYTNYPVFRQIAFGTNITF
jgi:TonB-linked SusC/RagA family outer membrane protein